MSTPKVDGEPLEPNSVDEGEAEVVVVVEAEMTSTGQDSFARGARLLAPRWAPNCWWEDFTKQ